MSILNEGINLSPDHLNNVFDRGFRSIRAKQKYPAGTGFGLYIARRIVDIHEGEIEASINNKYTIFTVTLPVKGLRGKARFRA